MTSRRTPEPVGAALLSFLACLWIAYRHGSQLASFVASSPRLAQWDMAKYATSGQRLAASLADFDLLRFFAEIHDLSVWPPTYPLLEMPVIWIWGLGAPALRSFQVALYSAMIVATWWALRRLDVRFGDAIGLTAAALVASSPLIAGLATVNMLEIPGLLLLALALGCYFRALDAEASGDQHQRQRWWRATWLMSLALFLCKYNYGLLWLLPVIAAEARRRLGSWPTIARFVSRQVSEKLKSSRLWRPWSVFVISMLGLVAAIRLSGGIDSEIFGQRLRATSAGGPAQILYVAIWLRMLVPWHRARALWQRIGELPIADRSFVRSFVLPAALWLLPPPHLKDFLFFLDNRDQGPAAGSWRWLSYYPQQTLEAYGGPMLGVAIAFFAMVGCLLSLRSTVGDRNEPKRRLIWLALASAAAALLAHPYKLPRFAVSLWWWLALAAALGLIGLFRLGHRQRPDLPWQGAALLSSVLIALGVSGWGFDLAKVEAEHHQRTVDAVTQEVLASLTLASAREEVPATLVLGTWNKLSPHLLEWHGRAEGLDDGRILSDFAVAHRKAWRLTSWLEKRSIDRLIVLERPGDMEFQQEMAWLEPVVAWLQAGDVYAPDGVREIGGYRIRSYSPVPESLSPSKPLASSSAKAAS